MKPEALIGYAFMAVIIILVIWLRTKGRRRPIRNKGFGMLIPVMILPIVFALTIYSLAIAPDQEFHVPVWWEFLCAIVLGAGLGSIMLYHTGYERREDGQVYSKPNKNFKYVLIAIIVLRVGLSEYFKGLDYSEFTILTMVLAFVYIGVWRVGSFVKYRRTV
ncbi:CcdC protein domain-containing protein [Paenibacillus sp. HB172176]|uniref:CcdC protein domain-containing protein n=1 Tax=Paenibacillus sp. HB172176 TaxID=2493690 RepID=UPI00143B357A|nr:CcdC protein domain-containing protein [Paenibacillus sp. HB172176]